MTIEFNNVVPIPLRNVPHGPKSAWGTQFSIDSSKRYLLTSDSGKGKTSFISFLYGSRSDFDGHILLDGRSWIEHTAQEKSETRKTRIGILPQDIKLFPQLSSLDNLKIKNQLAANKDEQELISLLKELGLGNQVHQKAGTLSQGQQQRVGIIRAILQPFEFLVMDEPFSHIDEGNILIAKDLILRSCDENNAGFLISTLGPDYGLKPDQIIRL